VTHSLAASLLGGLALGVSFNPLASLVGAPFAAAIAASPKRAARSAGWAAAALALAWLLGDGFRVMARLRDALDAATRPAPAALAALAIWALVALAAGYALPALAGAYVGRQVVRGSGRISAVVVAAACSGALVALASPASAWLGGLALR
jgi:hypothetical protein